MEQERNSNKNAELSMEQNGNMIDGIINNLPVPPTEDRVSAPLETEAATPVVPVWALMAETRSFKRVAASAAAPTSMFVPLIVKAAPERAENVPGVTSAPAVDVPPVNGFAIVAAPPSTSPSKLAMTGAVLAAPVATFEIVITPVPSAAAVYAAPN